MACVQGRALVACGQPMCCAQEGVQGLSTTRAALLSLASATQA